MADTGFVRFELERLLSTWENQIEYNLSESGVHPMTMRELLDDDALLTAIARLAFSRAAERGLGTVFDS